MAKFYISFEKWFLVWINFSMRLLFSSKVLVKEGTFKDITSSYGCKMAFCLSGLKLFFKSWKSLLDKLLPSILHFYVPQAFVDLFEESFNFSQKAIRPWNHFNRLLNSFQTQNMAYQPYPDTPILWGWDLVRKSVFLMY